MCSTLPIGEMVLISYSVINIIYRRYCRNGFKRKLCLFNSCLTAYFLAKSNTYRSAFRRLLGWTRRSGKNIPLEMRLKRAWLATECNGTMGWGMKWSFTG